MKYSDSKPIGLDEKARQLAARLQTIAQGAERQIPAVSETLSPQEIRVLSTVGCMDCPIMSAIAGAIRLSLSSVTGLIDRLCEKRLVRRDRSNEDRRVVQVELTEKGRELHQAAVEGRVAFARELLAALSAPEQDALVGLLGKVSERLEAKAKPG